MCFTITKTTIQIGEPAYLKGLFKVAKRNIPVFKVVVVENVPHDDVSVAQITSLYYGKIYQLGKEEIVPISAILDGVSYSHWHRERTYLYLTNGLHSYSPRKVNIDARNGYVAIGNKMYVLDTISIYKGIPFVAIMRCVIPKGALYIYNERGEYVSTSLIPVKVEFIK